MLLKKSLLLGSLLILTLGACSKEEEKSSNSKEVEVSFWRPQADALEDGWYIQKVQEFNELNKGKIKVNMEVISRGNSFAYEDKVNTNSISNTLPDILSLDGPNVANYAHSNIIVPLNDNFKSEELDDFLPSIISQGTYKDKLYALGLSESSVVLFYNKSIMKDLGIDLESKVTPENPLTIEEVYDISKKAKENLGVYGINWINDKGEWMTYCFGQFWLSNGTNIVSPDGFKSEGYINSEEGIKAAKYIQSFVKDGLFNIDPLPTEFQLGKAAFMLGGTWNIKGFKDYKDLDWGITYFPTLGKNTSPSGSWALSISKDSKNQEQAAEFIKFITNKENSLSLAKTISMPASRKSALESIEEYENTQLKVIKDQLKNTAIPRPVTPAYTIVTAKFAQALNDIMIGANVENSLNKAAKDIDLNISKTLKK